MIIAHINTCGFEVCDKTNSNALVLAYNTLVLDSHTSQLNSVHVRLGAIETIVGQSASTVRQVAGVTGASRVGYPWPMPGHKSSSTSSIGYPTSPGGYDSLSSSNQLTCHAPSTNSVDIYTVARDAMVVFQRFTVNKAASGNMCVPLAYGTMLAAVISPDLPTFLRMMFFHVMAFFMWNPTMLQSAMYTPSTDIDMYTVVQDTVVHVEFTIPRSLPLTFDMLLQMASFDCATLSEILRKVDCTCAEYEATSSDTIFSVSILSVARDLGSKERKRWSYLTLAEARMQERGSFEIMSLGFTHSRHGF